MRNCTNAMGYFLSFDKRSTFSCAKIIAAVIACNNCY